MSKRLINLKMFGCGAILIPSIVLGSAGTLWAQAAGFPQSARESRYDRTKAVPENHSRAAQEADSLVSLSADKIVALLVDEPGLFLQCKRLLVRNAFAQGRVIGPDDLTDDAVFRLVREDQNIRILFTREIEDRFYVRAKPTREELERDWEQKRVRVPDQAELQLEGSTNLKNATNEEQAYWLRHERDLDRSIPIPKLNQNAPMVPAPVPATPDEATRDLIAKSLDNSDTTSSGPLFGPAAEQSALLMRSSLGGGGGGGFGGDEEHSALGQGGGANDSAPSVDLLGPPGGVDPLESETDATLGSGRDLFGSNAGATAGLDASQSSASYARSRAYLLQGKEKQPTLRHRANPYADVPALYDLYAQYSRRTPKLDRFGIDIFQNGTGNLDMLPMDLPVGPDYVLGPGDGLTINLFGGISQRLRRVVDREGRVVLPEVG
jgi:hypothetical protein